MATVKAKNNTISTGSMSVLVRPHITEKASVQAESNVYTFEVRKNATKKSVGTAIAEFYKVTPIRVNIVNLPSKKVIARGKEGRKGGLKKAHVLLKAGDKIEFV